MFGGHTTEDMKLRLGIKSTRPLADFLPTLTIAAKNLATEMTNYNVEQKDLYGENLDKTRRVFESLLVEFYGEIIISRRKACFLHYKKKFT